MGYHPRRYVGHCNGQYLGSNGSPQSFPSTPILYTAHTIVEILFASTDVWTMNDVTQIKSIQNQLEDLQTLHSVINIRFYFSKCRTCLPNDVKEMEWVLDDSKPS